MKGKTIHITIQPETVVGCLDALTKVAGIQLGNRPLNQLIALTLEGFIGTMRKNGDIPHVEPDEALRRIAIVEMGYDPHQPPDFGRPMVDTTSLDLPRTEDLQNAIDSVRNQGAELPIDVNEAPQRAERAEKAERETLLNMPRESLEDLALRSSTKTGESDLLLDKAFEKGGDTRIATEIVYSKLPKVIWGSDKARELIEKVIEEIRG